MTKIEFKFHLIGASFLAYKFGRNYITNDLPLEFKYDIELNVSADDPKLEQFDIYPEDNGIIRSNLSDEGVVELLYRKNKIPVWIDINIYRVTTEETIFKLLCAGRYSNNKDEFYYNKNGSGPFGIKSPILPPNFNEGTKFEL